MKLFQSIFLSMIVAVLFSACAGSSSKKNDDDDRGDVERYKLDNRPLVNDRNSLQQDFFLNLVDSHSTDSSLVYTALSLFDEDTVGFDIEFMNDIPAGVTAQGTPDEESGFREGSIKFIGIGHYSDNFVKALKEIFDMESASEMRRDTLSPLVFSSNTEPVDLHRAGTSTYSFKLFFENTLGPEAEMFAVLDLYRKSFVITEKDETFRANILSAFTGL